MARSAPFLHRGARERRIAANVLELLKDWSSWVHRRVESIALEDKESELRRISVDLTLPDGLDPVAEIRDGRRLFFVPLSFLKKQPLTQFDLRDESGAALPLLSRRRNGRLATAVLVLFGEERFRELKAGRERRLPDSVGEDIELIARGSPAEAANAWEHLGQARPGDDSVARRWRKALAEDEAFMALASDLAYNFLVTVPLICDTGVRRILKFSYLQLGAEAIPELPPFVARLWRWAQRLTPGAVGATPEEQRPRVREIGFSYWLKRGAALLPKLILLETPAVGYSSSYHLEIEAPDGLQITRAELGAQEEDVGHIQLHSIAKSVQRAHLYLSEIKQGAFGGALVYVRPRPGTILRAAALASAITTSLLIVFALRWDEVITDLALILSLLLLIPAGLSAYVARPREPAVTTSVLFGARLLAVAPAAWSVAAATILTAGRSCETAKGATTCSSWSWTGELLWLLVALSVLTTAALAAGWIRAARPPECTD